MRNNKKIILLFVPIILFSIFLILIWLPIFSRPTIQDGEKQPQALPQKNSEITNDIDTKGNGSGFEDQKAESSVDLENRGYYLSQLKEKLPYKGMGFSLSYNEDGDFFVLNTNKGNSGTNTELKQFLNKNNINDVSWLYNLKQSSQAN